jgi:hypothetical protein
VPSFSTDTRLHTTGCLPVVRESRLQPQFRKFHLGTQPPL